MRSNESDALREFIREVLLQELNEFAAVGGGAGTGHSISGYTLPLGVSNKNKKRKKTKKIDEAKSKSLSGVAVGDLDYTFNNHIRYPFCEDNYGATEHFEYYDGIDVLVRAFALANNPFGKNKKQGIKRSLNYLKGNLNYPHLA